MRTLLLLLPALAACGDSPPPIDQSEPEPVRVRFATFNVSLHRDAPGGLVQDLSDPEHQQARKAAAILQEVRPDVLLLNEVDWDEEGEAVRLLREHFLEVSQGGREPLVYDHVYLPAVNTGVASGVDLDGDGHVETTPGSQAYGNDSLGFGLFPGQYGLVVLSRFPMEDPRTFRELLWRDVPGNSIPEGFYSEAALEVLPLSSKTHADVPIAIGAATVHFLVSHPTPPVFDGPENRNGRRNHDEIAFWTGYVGAGAGSWHVDDAGRRGGLAGAPFVVAGDLNADPHDGDSWGGAVNALLAAVGDPEPESLGAVEQAELQGQANASHTGPHAQDTADFRADTVGNLRVDYVLPSPDLPVAEAGVFWPVEADPLFELVGTFPFPVSDHRLVWVDVDVAQD